MSRVPILDAKRLGEIEHLRFRLKASSSMFGKTEFYHLDSIDSTNEYAKRLAATGAVEQAIVLADQQTGGKGRQGRVWHSPRLAGLWCSLLLSPRLPLRRIGFLPLMTSVVVSSAILDACGISPEVKWPNDIFLNTRKIAGILVESVVQGGRLLSVIFGIGVNINQALCDFPEEIRPGATSLKAETAVMHSREDLLFRILSYFEAAYLDLVQNNDAAIRETWLQRCGHLHRQLAIVDGSQEVQGVCIGIDTNGRLLLELDSGEVHAIHSGRIRILE